MSRKCSIFFRLNLEKLMKVSQSLVVLNKAELAQIYQVLLSNVTKIFLHSNEVVFRCVHVV